MNPVGAILFITHRRFPHFDEEFRKALVNADKQFPGEDDPSDDLLNALWQKLSTRKRLAISALGDDTDTLPNLETREALRGIICGAFRLQDELHEMNASDLRQLYQTEKSAEQMELDAEIERKDAWALHHSLEARTISPSWRLRARWTVEQGVALALGREPTVVNVSSLKQVLWKGRSPFVRAYINLMEDVELAVQAGELEAPLQPSDFAQWLDERQIILPQEAMPSSLDESRADLEAMNASLVEENGRLLQQLDQLNADVSNLQTELAAKDGLIKDLREDVDEMNHKRKVTLYKIVLGLAINKFSYDPVAVRSKGVSNIVSALALTHYSVKEDAVKNVLEDAHEFLSG